MNKQSTIVEFAVDLKQGRIAYRKTTRNELTDNSLPLLVYNENRENNMIEFGKNLIGVIPQFLKWIFSKF